MERENLVRYYPRLFHATFVENWDGMRQYGLFSASTLLDRFEVDGDRRDRLERQRRTKSKPLKHSEYGRAILRDNGPSSDAMLKRCLEIDLEPEDWYAILNRRVFFWATCERLKSFLQAYRATEQLVIVVPTERLIEAHHDQIELTTINTGTTRSLKPTRGPNTFRPLSDFDFDEVRKELHLSREKVVAEVTVLDAVERLAEMASVAIRLSPSGTKEVIWRQREARA